MTSGKKMKQAIFLRPFFIGLIFFLVGYLIFGFLGGFILAFLGLILGLLLKTESHGNDSKSKVDNNSKGQKAQMNLSFECEEDESKYIGHYLFIDIETTGLPIDYKGEISDTDNWPYIVQIAWLMFNEERKLIVREDHILKQNVIIPESAIRIHGITNEKMNEFGESPINVLNELTESIKEAKVVIAHNVDFDLPIVQAEFFRHDINCSFEDKEIICTMKSSVDYCGIYDEKHGDFKYPKLMELVKKCFYEFTDSIESSDVHNAKIDVHLTAKCFFKLLDIGIINSEKNNSDLTSHIIINTIPERNSLENLLTFSVKNLPDSSFCYEGKSPLFDNPDRYVKKLDHFELDIFVDIEIQVNSKGEKNVILSRLISDVSIKQVENLLNLFISIFGSDTDGNRELTKREKGFLHSRSDQFTRIWVVPRSRLVIFSFDGISLVITLPF